MQLYLSNFRNAFETMVVFYLETSDICSYHFLKNSHFNLFFSASVRLF